MKQNHSLVRGLLTGAVAGLAGSLMMAAVQEVIARDSDSSSSVTDITHAPLPDQENTTETAARRVMSRFGHPLSRSEKQYAGRALHYGFGLVMGALYGVASEYLPVVGIGGGTVFGAVLFLGTDELILPVLRLAMQPTQTPPVEHLLHLASHVVYGSTLELTRNQLVRLV